MFHVLLAWKGVVESQSSPLNTHLEPSVFCVHKFQVQVDVEVFCVTNRC